MKKSLVVHAHSFGNCTSGPGLCVGTKTAQWLNGLGDDNQKYIELGGKILTVYDIRRNWASQPHLSHVVFAREERKER